MIILTTPKIKKYKTDRISSIVEYAGTKFCLAEMEYSIEKREPAFSKVDFWWKLCPSLVDIEDFDSSLKFKGGIIESIELQLYLSKERNIAYAIYAIAHNEGIGPFELWENSIL